MSFLPPTAVNDAWSLLQIISDPDKARAALELLKKESETAAEIMEGVRTTQREVADKIAFLNAEKKEFDRVNEEWASSVKKQERELYLIENEQKNRINVISQQEKDLESRKQDLVKRTEEMFVREVQLNERDDSLSAREKNLSDREAKVKAILEDFGPLAEKLKG